MRFFSLLLLAAVLSFAQTAPRPAATRKPASVTAAPARPDAEIERAIKARFARSKVGRNNFQVRVQGGIATLEGNTDVVQHKGAATRMAKTAGARAVVNNIRISEAARQKAAARLAQVRKATVRSE